MKEITITKREEGQRFDRFLIKYLPGASSGFLHKMLRKKNIKLNGKKAEGREKLTAGDLIQIFFSDIGTTTVIIRNIVSPYLTGCTPLDGMHTKFIEFCDFVLRNFDHRNFAFVSAALAGRKKLQWRF